MRRRSLLVGGAAGMVLNISPRGARAERPRPVFLLVHGAWHGGWCWRRVAEMGLRGFAPDGVAMQVFPDVTSSASRPVGRTRHG